MSCAWFDDLLCLAAVKKSCLPPLPPLPPLHQENDSHPPAAVTEILPDAPGPAHSHTIQACLRDVFHIRLSESIHPQPAGAGHRGASRGEAHGKQAALGFGFCPSSTSISICEDPRPEYN